MVTRSYVVDATMEHVEYLKDKIRPMDEYECYSVVKKSSYECLKNGLNISLMSKTIMVGDEPTAIYGVAPYAYSNIIGAVWLLGSDNVSKATNVLVKQAHVLIEEMFQYRKILLNYVHEDNKISLKWLKKIGFDVGEKHIYGWINDYFHLCIKVKEGGNYV